MTAENFPVDPNGHHRLAYRPAKTRESSNRRDTIEKYYCDPYKSHTALPASPLAAFLGVDPGGEK